MQEAISGILVMVVRTLQQLVPLSTFLSKRRNISCSVNCNRFHIMQYQRHCLHSHSRGNNPATVAFNDVKLPPCQSLSYQFNNVSTAGSPFTNTSLFGILVMALLQVTAGTASVTHAFTAAGSYIVKLILLIQITVTVPIQFQKH